MPHTTRRKERCRQSARSRAFQSSPFGRITGAKTIELPQLIREMSTSNFYPAGHHPLWMES
jgi:hypothetical protein